MQEQHANMFNRKPNKIQQVENIPDSLLAQKDHFASKNKKINYSSRLEQTSNTIDS